MRTFLGALILTLALFVASAAAAPNDRGVGPAAGPPKGDRDRDGLFDDLEARLAGRPSDARFDVIVVATDRPTGDLLERLRRAAGSFRVEDRFSIVPGFAATVTKRQALALAGSSDVVHVEENSRVRALNDTAQSSFGVSKARLDAPALDGNGDANPATYSSADLVAAVIDTGIDPLHRDLDEGKVIAFRDFVNGRTTAYDDEGHGTHVAGTIAGEGDARADRLYKGVAPAAALVGVKVLDRRGSGTEADVVSGIEWVVNNRVTHGIEAINLSLGTEGCSDGTSADSLAVNSAHAAGLVVAVAAGNEGPGPCTVGDPGAATGALTVGAMADTGELGFTQAFFSSRGKTLDGRIKPDVTAPGVAINSADAGTTAGYFEDSGTSMATPFVAGVALLMRDANSALTPQQVKDKMMQTAIDWGRGGDNRTAGTTGPDIDYGAGRLDAYAAIRSAGAAINTPPIVPVHEFREGSLSGTGAVASFPIEVPSTQFPIAATLIIALMPGGSASSPDFDLYLRNPSGAVVAESEFSTRQEEVGFNPTVTGTYTLEVRSFSGSGPFFLDISKPPKPSYARPQGAAILRVPLVQAYEACGDDEATNRTHGPGLTHPSCSPATQESSHLTVGTQDANGAQAQSVGSAQFRVIPGNGGTTTDEADLDLRLSITDVRRRSNLSDYTGQLGARMTVRITDRHNGSALDDAATVTDVPFRFTVPCSATSTGDIGSTCSVDTRADTLAPGTIVEGKRSIWELDQLEVTDGGADGLVSTADNTPFARQGIFVP